MIKCYVDHMHIKFQSCAHCSVQIQHDCQNTYYVTYKIVPAKAVIVALTLASIGL